MRKDEWQVRGHRNERRLERIAKHLGKEHPITKMLGSLAWGRHDWEIGPNSTLQGEIIRASALEGVFKTINRWARDNDTIVQRQILSMWHDH